MNNLRGRENLLQAIASYQPWDEQEKAHQESMVAFLQREPNCFDRSVLEGHVTGSAWIINPEGTKCLLVHHKKLNRWLQPGGHADGNPDIFDVSKQEAREETGLENLDSDGDIFDIDVHLIPARKSDPAHFHYDVRFKFTASTTDSIQISVESNAVRWISLDELDEYAGDEPSIRRMADKTLTSPGSE
ncbi:NUDIX hydrolase [Fulvivirga sedimenti]|uniref:NUDIX hydrolase n=1 Tax=Fulvivirga sedimenti TaxID=2879465 RepID=A0A9X1L022_9BACT|nr:NUDIX hydrolase [Fulvivirga sedimenti]MCA6075361.1 NUDIX hydrolase [Fulvivirga sedimenti]MCA6076538.1 NUDIX hydrolase [Fulvivirga sedimenti]MCA6077666.1 NUDIX hydrolase [Fulvivirga sedimenti]